MEQVLVTHITVGVKKAKSLSYAPIKTTQKQHGDNWATGWLIKPPLFQWVMWARSDSFLILGFASWGANGGIYLFSRWEEGMSADIYMQCTEACWVYSKCSISVVCLWVKPDQVVFCTVVCVRLSSRETCARKVKWRHRQTLKKDVLQARTLNIGSIAFSEHFPNGSMHR